MLNENQQVNHSSELRQPTPTQESTAQLLFYLDSLSILNRQAHIYANSHFSRRRIPDAQIADQSRRSLYLQTKAQLVDLFFLNQGLTSIPQLEVQAMSPVNTIYEGVLPQIEERYKKQFDRAASLSRTEIFLATVRAARKLSSLTESEQSYLLQHIGYAPKEVEDATKHLATSAVLTGGLTGADTLLSASFGAQAAIDPLLATINDPHTQLLVLASYALRYASYALRTQQSIRLLEHYETSPTLQATVAYLLLKKLYPDKNALANFSVYFTSLLPPITHDILIAGFLATPLGPSIIAARNLATIILNGGIVAGGEIALRRGDNNPSDGINQE